MTSGWIKLHRKMLENPIVCKDCEHMAAWCWMLLSAAHREYAALFRGKKVTLVPGQLITSRAAMAAALKISESKAERILKNFAEDGQITQEKSNRSRLITLCSWEEYQKSEVSEIAGTGQQNPPEKARDSAVFRSAAPESGQQPDSSRTTGEPHCYMYNKKEKKEKKSVSVPREHLRELLSPLEAGENAVLELGALMEQGATERLVQFAAETAARKGKPWCYAAGIIRAYLARGRVDLDTESVSSAGNSFRSPRKKTVFGNGYPPSYDIAELEQLGLTIPSLEPPASLQLEEIRI